jgi:hypothetical protein
MRTEYRAVTFHEPERAKTGIGFPRGATIS